MSAGTCNHPSSGCDCEEPGHIKAGGICMDCGGKVGHREEPVTINDGGPAFPTNGPDHGVYGAGLSLRDYFAAKAMQVYAMKITTIADAEDFDATIARYAYETADAMLAAREPKS